jgi:ATP synthase protein I
MPADGIEPTDASPERDGDLRSRDAPGGEPVGAAEPESGQERQASFRRRIASRAEDRLRARRQRDRTLFHAFASSGMVGWSVVVPTLLGLAVGSRLDRHVPAPWSWSLTLMLGGLALGCWNAWQWIVSRENDQDDDDDS